MYAVIKTGGKQYKVAPGHTLKVDKLKAEIGDKVEFNNVLMVGNNDDIRIGTPLIDSGKVTATVLDQARDKKIRIIKFKRRKHHLKHMGHRQYYTEVRITGVMADGIEEIWQPQTTPVSVEPSVQEVKPIETEGVIQTETMSSAAVIDNQITEAVPLQTTEVISNEAETKSKEEVKKPDGT
jgi:large subunit ribosomal protein L21